MTSLIDDLNDASWISIEAESYDEEVEDEGYLLCIPRQPTLTLQHYIQNRIWRRIELFNESVDSYLSMSGASMKPMTTSALESLGAFLRTHRSPVAFSVVPSGGASVALHNTAQSRFIRTKHAVVDARGGQIEASALPSGWKYERYSLVATADGAIALYSECDASFVRIDAAEVHARGGPIQRSKLPADWACARFQVRFSVV